MSLSHCILCMTIYNRVTCRFPYATLTPNQKRQTIMNARQKAVVAPGACRIREGCSSPDGKYPRHGGNLYRQSPLFFRRRISLTRGKTCSGNGGSYTVRKVPRPGGKSVSTMAVGTPEDSIPDLVMRPVITLAAFSSGEEVPGPG